MKRKRVLFLCGLAASVLALSAAAPPSKSAAAGMIEYSWTCLGNDDLFDHWCNWDTTGCPGEGIPPDGTDDNATFPSNSGTAWTVDLTTETIGDLIIEESVDFNGASSHPGPALAVNSLIVDATNAAITVTIDGHFEFTANEP